MRGLPPVVLVLFGALSGCDAFRVCFFWDDCGQWEEREDTAWDTGTRWWWDTGTYTYWRDEGGIRVSPTAVSFGEVAPGATVTRYVYVTNEGSGPLTLTGAMVLDNPAGTFSVGHPPLARLDPYDQAVFELAFNAPSQATVPYYEATLQITSDDWYEPTVTVPLYGAVDDEAVLTPEPTSLDFGYVELGCEATLPLVVRPNYVATLDTLSFTDDAFSLETAPKPGTTFTNTSPLVLDVTFEALAFGTRSGLLYVQAAPNVLGIALTGIGIAKNGFEEEVALVKEPSAYWPLAQLAVASTVDVLVDDDPWMPGWVYDVATNAVRFDLKTLPPKGSEIRITYVADACAVGI